MPRVTANGRAVELADGAAVTDLLAVLGVRSRFLVVERNGEPLAREAYATTILAAGDQLEIVSPVGGG